MQRPRASAATALTPGGPSTQAGQVAGRCAHSCWAFSNSATARGPLCSRCSGTACGRCTGTRSAVSHTSPARSHATAGVPSGDRPAVAIQRGAAAGRQARTDPCAAGRVADHAGRHPAGGGGAGRAGELPQQTLAAMLGVARPSLNKVLKDLEPTALIRISYAAIEVLDRARLTGHTCSPLGYRGPHHRWH